MSKGSFLAKSVSTPTGTKMTFPSNVRIISVPTGSNIAVASGHASSGHASGTTQKIVTSTAAGATSQVNNHELTQVFVHINTFFFFFFFFFFFCRRTFMSWN